jgi:hypothetical protein
VENGRHGQPGGSFLESESEKKIANEKKRDAKSFAKVAPAPRKA